MKLEIAAFNTTSALIAYRAGAHRVELCNDMSSGGTTPDIETFEQVKEQLDIDIYTMIRPRGGDFCYTENEFHEMLDSIALFKKLGSDGFVFGVLDERDQIDIERNRALVAAAKGLPCTFHRAFDRCTEHHKALENVIACGFNTILTSGFATNVDDGLLQLSELVSAAGERITIMPGGGLRAANLCNVINHTKAEFYHSSGIREGMFADLSEISQMSNILSSYHNS